MKRKYIIFIILAAVIRITAYPQTELRIRVIAETVNIYSAADVKSAILLTTEAGTIYPVIEKTNDWYSITLPSGGRAYILRVFVEEIAEAVPNVKPIAPSIPPELRVRVAAEAANIYGVADVKSAVVMTVKAGTIFPVIKKTDDWYTIALPSGDRAYIPRSDVVEIVEPAVPVVKPIALPKETQPTIPATLVGQKSTPQTEAPTPDQAQVSFSMVLIRAGYFVATDSAYTDVYKNGAIFGGELRIGKKKIVGWLEANYRAETGQFTVTKESTDVKVLVVEGGVLYRIVPKKFSPYVGAGIGYYIYDERSNVLRGVRKSQIGFSALGGISYILGKRIVLDGRVKYDYCKMKPADFNIDIGGLTAGIGLGFHF